MSGFKTHLMRWVTGTPVGRAAIHGPAVVLEDADLLPEVLVSQLIGPGSTVFVPADGSPDGSWEARSVDSPVVVPHDGSLAQVGGESLLPGSLYLQIRRTAPASTCPSWDQR